MRKYEVKLEGRNFLCAWSKAGTKKLGFFVTRYVESENPEEAELKAVELVRSIESLRTIVRNSREDPPRLFLDTITELNSFEGVENLEPGIIFYDEENEKGNAT